MRMLYLSTRWLAAGLMLLPLVGTGCAHRSQQLDQQPRRATLVDRTPLPADPAQPEWDGVIHTVLPGQTLWRISRAYGTTVEELAHANSLDDPSLLTAGSQLLIPGATKLIELPTLSDTPAWTWPVPSGRISSYFGASRRNRQHQGLDIIAKRGEAVLAARAGRVTYSGSSMRGYGQTIIINHGDGMSSLYAHNSKLLVRLGQRVDRGQTIALVGKTGNASTEHCHLEIRKHQVAVDPLRFMSTTHKGERR
jgi:murein DD-endopeptidase MepM/ murein hydrolase activator NlpD